MKRILSALLLCALSSTVSIHFAFADDMDFGNIDVDHLNADPQAADAAATLKAPAYNLESTAPANDVVNATAVKAEKSKWSEIKRNIGVGFFQYATMDTDEANRNRGKLNAYNYLTLEYRTGRGEKVFFRPAFTYQTGGDDFRGRSQDEKFQWNDAFIGYASYNIPWLPFEMDYKTEVRLYLPTSDTSQNEGMIARLRGDLKAHYPLSNRLTFLLWFKPDYFFQRRTAKLSADGRYANGTRDYGYELSANLFYLMRGGVFGWGGSIGHEQSWSHDSVVERVSVFRREDVSVQAFIGINKWGFLTHIGIDQTRNVSRPYGPLVAMNDSEMQYFARTYYRF